MWASVKDKEKRISSQNKWALQETEQILWERMSESEYSREDYQERATQPVVVRSLTREVGLDKKPPKIKIEHKGLKPAGEEKVATITRKLT